jgi:hypothetical protein
MYYDLTLFFTVDDAQDINVDTVKTPDPANVADTDAFKELTRSIDFPSGGGIDCAPVENPLPDDLENPQQQTNPIEAGAFETGTTVVVVVRFPSESAGAPIPGVPRGSSRYELHRAMHRGSVWEPFWTQCDWEVARWAKSCGATSSAVTNLLAIPEVNTTFISEFRVTKSEAKVVDRLGLSYSNANELNAIIDSDLPGQPPFQRKEVIIGDERLEFHSRDIIECIRSLYGDPQFTQDLAFAPE